MRFGAVLTALASSSPLSILLSYLGKIRSENVRIKPVSQSRELIFSVSVSPRHRSDVSKIVVFVIPRSSDPGRGHHRRVNKKEER